jgi:hypothetical protein
MDAIETTAPDRTPATTAPEGTVYDPAPGTEYRYVISDYARAAARVLGVGWGSESGWYGAFGLIWGPRVDHILVYVDTDPDCGGLTVAVGSGFDRVERLVDLPDGAPSDLDELQVVAEHIASTVRSLV